MWCMLAINSKYTLGDWLASLPDYMPGNRMDGINTLLTVLPDADILSKLSQDKIIYLPSDAELIDLVMLVGRTLASDSDDTIIIGPPDQWEQLYNTPHWWIWSAPNIYASDDDDDYQAKLAALGLPSSTTRADARQIIKTLVSGGGS